MFKSDNELDNFVNNIKFDACASGNNDDLQKKFHNAISNLENVETNGNNTDIPFYREKSHFNTCELKRIKGNNDDLQKKFHNAISNLENVETNGNNTDIPFYREKSHFNTCELKRINDITNKLNENIPPLTNFDNIRFYILLIQCDNTTYRLYIYILRHCVQQNLIHVS